MLEQKRQRHQRKAELGKRRSAASQNRMRIISQLGAEDNQLKKRSKKIKEDTFGMNDEDWNVYRDIVSEKRKKSTCMFDDRVLPLVNSNDSIECV